MPRPTYTIAVCSYNMEDTIQKSLESMLEQVTDEYEILVVDDSTDDSGDILAELASEWDNLRVVDDCNNNNIAEARNVSFEQARGQYVLVALDVDDVYEPVIQDFVAIYHALEEAVGHSFFLSGQNINIGPRQLLCDVSYRSLGYGEDRDFWRRLMKRNAYIGMKHRPVAEQIGYHRNTIEQFKVGFENIVVQFQSGMRFWPYLRWANAELLTGRGRPRSRALAHIILALPAYAVAMQSDTQYEAPKPYDDMSVWKQALRSQTMTLAELEDHYEFTVNRTALSQRGRELLDVDDAAFGL